MQNRLVALALAITGAVSFAPAGAAEDAPPGAPIPLDILVVDARDGVAVAGVLPTENTWRRWLAEDGAAGRVVQLAGVPPHLISWDPTSWSFVQSAGARSLRAVLPLRAKARVSVVFRAGPGPSAEDQVWMSFAGFFERFPLRADGGAFVADDLPLLPGRRGSVGWTRAGQQREPSLGIPVDPPPDWAPICGTPWLSSPAPHAIQFGGMPVTFRMPREADARVDLTVPRRNGLRVGVSSPETVPPPPAFVRPDAAGIAEPGAPAGRVRVTVRSRRGSSVGVGVRVFGPGGEQRTDAEGTVRFESVSPGMHRVSLLESGFVPTHALVVVKEGTTSEPVLAERSGGSLHVTVTDSRGQPLPFARVRLLQPSMLPYADVSDDGVQRIDDLTDASGTRIFQHVEPGRISVLLDWAGELVPAEAVVSERQSVVLTISLPAPTR